MLRIVLLLVLLGALPGAAQAQAFRCTDASGAPTYTDQPCPGGALVVPAPSAAQQAAEAERAADAQARLQALRATSQQMEQARLAREETQAAVRAAVPPAESSACRAARDAATAASASTSTTLEERRTARANAALACGQAPPEEPTVVWGGGWRYPRGLRPMGPGYPGVGFGPGWQRPVRPQWNRPAGALPPSGWPQRPQRPHRQRRPPNAHAPAAGRRPPASPSRPQRALPDSMTPE